MKTIELKTKPGSIELPANDREYEVDGKTFIVKPVFKEDSGESITSILIKLMQLEN